MSLTLNLHFVDSPSSEYLFLIAFPSFSFQKYGRGWKKLQTLHAKGQVTGHGNSPPDSPAKQNNDAGGDKQPPARNPTPAPAKQPPAPSPSAGPSQPSPAKPAPAAASPAAPPKAPQKGWL